MTDTGIALYVYNRPRHTRRVLEGLERNDVDKLYVFADGPDESDDEDLIRSTRGVVAAVDWCDVDLVERDENLGLKESWIRGFDYVLERHDRVVGFEDDCVPAGDCIDYFETCLDRYDDDERVMNVHGYGPPIELPDGYGADVYFTYRSGSWGQATWKNAWQKFERNRDDFARLSNSPELREKLNRAGDDLYPMFEREIKGKIDSVGVWWAWTLVKHDGVSVNPVNSRVKNIGHDGSGVHSLDTEYFETRFESVSRDITFPDAVEVTEQINDRYTDFMSGPDISLLPRIASRILDQLR